MKTRLAAMMFIQYVVMGATWPIMSLYLRDHLHFSGSQTGVVMAMSAMAAFVAPVITACVADRLLCAERLLSICHFAGGSLMLIIGQQNNYHPMVFLYLLYNLVMGPTVALTNAIVFHNHPDGRQSFGTIRVWGTLGWIAVAWGFGFLWLHSTGTEAVASRLPDALQLSALTSLFLGVYGLTLPHPQQRQEGPLRIIPLDSLRVLLRPRILLIGTVSLIVGTVDRYYYFGMAPFLSQNGFSDALIMPLMSLGQMTEVLAMFGLGTLLHRLGFKWVFLMGLSAEVLRFGACAIGQPLAMVIAALPCHGIAYTLYCTAAYIYIDSHCAPSSRAGLHQLFSIITAGFGALIANLLAGVCLDHLVSPTESPNFRSFWAIPLVISLVGFGLIALLFKEDNKTAEQQ